ncbi:thioesterase family protein [Sulfitobacter sp. F26169L]|uniref:acyl-CoA thioesterase n=1 Tax=Sulfitobacter sp. F26169L TaxID=2996015 RepID=UPI002B221699|nr:thioesterase family protein [Sulfitobacter sp. F26169L]
MPFLTPLSPEQQRVCGLQTPQPVAIADRVRFSELDVLKHVNNVAYLEWFERARVEYFRQRGLWQSDAAPDAPRTVVRSGEVHYIREVLPDEAYVATCGCKAFRNTSYSLHQEIWAAGTLRATFDCVMVMLEPDGNSRRPIPQNFRKSFVELDGATPP